AGLSPHSHRRGYRGRAHPNSNRKGRMTMTFSDRTRIRFLPRQIMAAVTVTSCLAVTMPAQAEDLTPEQQALHQHLRDLKDRLGDALNSGNIDAALAEPAPAISFTAMNNEVAHNQEGVRQYFAKMMTGDNRVVQAMTVSFEPDQLATIYGDDNAV